MTKFFGQFSTEGFMINNHAHVEKINSQQKLKHISDAHLEFASTETAKPVFKYHSKTISSKSLEINSSSKRLSEQTSENSVGINCGISKNNQQSFESGVVSPGYLGSTKNLCNNPTLNEKTINLETSSLLARTAAVTNLLSPRAGLTGSLITGARLQKRNMFTDFTEMSQLYNKNNQNICISNGRQLPSSHFPIDSFSTLSISEQKWPSSSIFARQDKQRPQSASLRSPTYNSKATNTFDSCLGRGDQLLKPILHYSISSNLKNGAVCATRPASSHRQRLMNSHSKSIKNSFSVSSKIPNQSVKDLCIVNHNPTMELPGSSSNSFSATKKLKPFGEEQHKTKTALTKDRINGLTKLNLAIKTSALGNTAENTSCTSVSSLTHLSGVSSSCSFCSESKSDCICKVGSKSNISLKDHKHFNYNIHNKYNTTATEIKNSVKVNKVRSPTTGGKSKKKTVFGTTSTKSKSSNVFSKKLQEIPAIQKNSDIGHTDRLAMPSKKNVNNHFKEDLPNKFKRSCGDGAEGIIDEGISKETDNCIIRNLESTSGRLPGDGIELSENQKNVDGFSQEFNYEDSLLDGNLAADEEEDYRNEIIDDIDSCQGSDLAIGEYFPCDDDDALDCIDDSTVASLDEDCGISECAESESSGIEAYYLSQSKETSIENTKPAVIKSIFSRCPPVINFSTHTDSMEPLPPNIRKLLKWKMSSITPIVVRNTVMRSGFKPSKKSYDWSGYFGKHMKSNGFRSLREYQKINHFPGSFQLGRKDRLWRNISRMQTRFGKKEFGFVPRSYVLPWDKKLLKNAWEEGGAKQKFILKPPASARGIGIKVIHKWNQVPMKKPILVQKYLSRPFLINGNKFDLRLYVHVTSFDPLRIYLFHDGLVRFATCKYSASMKHLSNKYMHLTNYSINKKSGEFEQNDDASVCQGHKWSIKALWGYLKQQGINTDKIWEQMKDIIIKTVISVEQYTNSLVKSNCRRRYCCHELFGFDIMLDDRLRPWLLEVNISPSLHSNSPLDVQIKGVMVKDMFNLCGFLLPDKKQIAGNAPVSGSNVPSASASFSQDKRKQSIEVAADSKAKHTYFAQHYKVMDEQAVSSLLLDILTVNDIRILVESVGEAARRGEFQKIFPCLNRKYLNFFEQPRYYNELLHAWEQKYSHQPAKGIELLETFCRKGLHLPHVMTDPTIIPNENVWTPNYLTQAKIAPSPRNDLKYFSKPTSNNNLAVYSPPMVTTLSMTTGRCKSAKSYRTTSSNSSPSSIVVPSKAVNPAPIFKSEA